MLDQSFGVQCIYSIESGESDMRFKSVFSIIGPAMIGPSSSHTAGAVRIGRFARRLLGEQPTEANICFYGSFAETFKGHGTDLAVMGGILDYNTDDEKIRDSLHYAEVAGIHVTFSTATAADCHPNTVKIRLKGQEQQIEVMGASIGGGTIVIQKINGFDIKCTGELPALVIHHDDYPGVLASITTSLHQRNINIGFITTDRTGRTAKALTVVETDDSLSPDVCQWLAKLPHVNQVTLVDLA